MQITNFWSLRPFIYNYMRPSLYCKNRSKERNTFVYIKAWKRIDSSSVWTAPRSWSQSALESHRLMIISYIFLQGSTANIRFHQFILSPYYQNFASDFSKTVVVFLGFKIIVDILNLKRRSSPVMTTKQN